MKIDFDFDPEDLNLGELAELEDIAGKPVSEVIADLVGGVFSTDILIKMIEIVGRRQDPNFNADDARKVKLNDIILPADQPATVS